MGARFCHLHNHTEYSLLDGASRIQAMVQRAVDLEMPALAITDHGVMFGVVEFHDACRSAGIRPVLGMEAYVAPNGLHKKNGREENETYHLVLLAKDMEGYRNLCKLHSIAALQGFYYKPRIDHDVLRQHSKGLIGTTSCLGSEVCQQLLNGQYDRAQYLAGMYKELFDEDSYFVELQDHGLPEQKLVNEKLLEIAKELRLPLLATNDSHYLCRGDAGMHDVLLAIGTQALLADPNRFKFKGEEFYLKSEKEMAELFPHQMDALENTLRVAEMCDVTIDVHRASMPAPVLPEGQCSTSYLRELAERGVRDRVAQPDELYWQRLDYELTVIAKEDFNDYFLLVREFANFTRQEGIMYGVRGSAAGSLVSFAIGVTDVDPVKHDLTFERFLNPERATMPDIDMDFEDARRDEVIRWVVNRFGTERVAQIITFGTLGAKASIRDAGRVMGYAPSEVDRLCKMIPGTPGMTIQGALDSVPEFRGVVESDARSRELVLSAARIEGISRNPGVHAAGVVITRKPLDNYIPLYRGNDGQAVTAYEMGILERLKMLKMDFLGLANLTVLSRAIENIRQTRASILDDPAELAKHPVLTGGHLAIPFDDEPTYHLLGRGDTVGVFQLESGGMRKHIVNLKPKTIGELAAMVALFRPGPMEHIPQFINQKFGRAKIEYLDERMEPILRDTYGIIVYQDQVIKLVQALAGFSLGRADMLRRAMSKKDRESMDAMYEEYLAGCDANKVERSVAEKVWELLIPFSGYAFNKAHAVCYAILAYQTAYLKTNYLPEFLAALLSAYCEKESRVATFIEECRRCKVPVQPPDVNRSQSDFTVESVGGSCGIRFGLRAIKNVGQGLVSYIVEERAQGPYTHLYEFCERVRSAGLNKSSADALIRSGALDSIDPNRNKLLMALDAALSYADYANRNRQSGQDSLFGESGPTEEMPLPTLADAPPPSRQELLAMEKMVLGIFVSDHPLRGFERAVARAATHTCGSISECADRTSVTVAGVITSFEERRTRSGDRMAKFLLEDVSGSVSCICYPRQYANLAATLVKDQVVAVQGDTKIDQFRRRNGPDEEQHVEVGVYAVRPLQPDVDLDQPGASLASGFVIVSLEKAYRKQLEQARELIAAHPGNYLVTLELHAEGYQGTLVLPDRVDATQEFVEQLNHIFSGGAVEVIASAGHEEVDLEEHGELAAPNPV